VNEAVRAYVSNIFRSHTIEGEKKELLGKLKKEDDRLHRSIELMTAELGNGGRAEQHERTGKILLANIYQLKRGTSEVDLPDPLAQDTSAHISLDPALSPAQNAEQYFEKAKRAKTARVETERRRHQMIVKSSFIKEIIVQLESCTTAAELKKFKKSYTKELKTMNLTPQQSPEERPPFRMFTVSGGFEVWVGKSSRNNDLLTMKFAKPNDLWFHVRGAGGSHTVLKVTGSADPSKKAILEAASIAAYYSKMRKAGSVPVAYCERKYVRKPRGLKEGAVTLEREKVVFVKPGLPNIEII
jgi:predicted ribosome quality control (RQC) complex YloA/Tae2 family protein